MLHRVKSNRQLRESIRLLKMRDQIQAQLGDAYAAATGAFTPFVTMQLKRYGCPRIATAHVLDLLDTQLAVDPAVQRLVMCAALDVALADEEIPLAG